MSDGLGWEPMDAERPYETSRQLLVSVVPVTLASWMASTAVYRRRWQPAMVLSGLAAVFEHAEYVPKIRRIRCDLNADRVLVTMLSGQAVEDFESSVDALANTFGALSCRVRVDRPGRIWLDFAHRDPLTTVIPALPFTEVPDLRALPLGKREAGTSWTLTLTGTHVLVAAADTGIRFTVPDAEAEHAAMRERGVNVGDVLRWEGVPPMYTFDDPDGNRFYIVEASR
jgi:hypothetical protein